MSESVESLRKKIENATDLAGVVRTMKALAASHLSQFEKSLQVLDEYDRTVELGIYSCFFHKYKPGANIFTQQERDEADVIVFGTDQGLVGRFNEVIGGFTLDWLAQHPAKYNIWVVGERVEHIFSQAGVTLCGRFGVPGSVDKVTGLIGNILGSIQSQTMYVFHNTMRPSRVIEPVMQAVLPLDALFLDKILKKRWPSKNLPSVLGDPDTVFAACVREYIFVSLFRACVQSLAGENASRLDAMQRAQKNIDEILDEFGQAYHRLRQTNIDEELFDVIAGFEALMRERKKHSGT